MQGTGFTGACARARACFAATAARNTPAPHPREPPPLRLRTCPGPGSFLAARKARLREIAARIVEALGWCRRPAHPTPRPPPYARALPPSPPGKSFLAAHKARLGEIADQSVEALGWCPKEVRPGARAAPANPGRSPRPAAAACAARACRRAALRSRSWAAAAPARGGCRCHCSPPPKAHTPHHTSPPSGVSPPPITASLRHPQVVTVTPDVSAIEAMALMNERHISALAVVDSAGKIIGAETRTKLGRPWPGCAGQGDPSWQEMRTVMAEHSRPPPTSTHP